MKTLNKTVLGIIIALVFLIISVEYFSYNGDYLFNNINKEVNVSTDDLKKVSTALADYLKGQRDTLNIVIKENGLETQAFNQREIHHMIDVKNIYSFIRNLKYVLLFIMLLMVALVRKKYLLNSMYYAFSFSLGVIAVLSVAIYFNFNKAFIFFHEVAFSNDLWLLNPKTDLLINLLPLGFFINISIHILLLFAGLQLISTIIIYYMKKKLWL